MEIYTGIMATVSAAAAIISLVKFWPRLIIMVEYNSQRKTNKPTINIIIHNGKRRTIAIAKTGFHMFDDTELSREHYHDSIGTTTIIIKPGNDHSEEWQIESQQPIKYAWAIDMSGNRYTGKVSKRVVQQIEQHKLK